MGPIKWHIPVARYKDPPPWPLSEVFKATPADELPVFDVIPAPIELDEVQRDWERMLDAFDKFHSHYVPPPLPVP